MLCGIIRTGRPSIRNRGADGDATLSTGNPGAAPTHPEDEPLSTHGPASKRRLGAALLWLTAALFLAGGAWTRDLFDADEGRYATVARHMWETGDYVVPRLDGMPFMDKPPMVYWIQAGAYHVFGPCAFLARLPTLLAGSLWCLLLFLFARRLTRDEGIAWTVGLTAATCAAGMLGARVGPQMDLPLATAILGVLYAAYVGLERMATRPDGKPGVGPQVGLGIAIGLGLLIKGPLVVAVPLLVAIGWGLAGVRRTHLLRFVAAPIAWVIALAIAAPWYVAVERAMPGWTGHFVFYEHFGRFSEGDHRQFHPFWFYVPIALLYLLPWTPLAWGRRDETERNRWWGPLRALVTASPWSPRPWRETLPERSPLGVPAWKLFFAWFIAAFLLYSVSTRKLLNYLLPAAPPLVLMTGIRLHAALDAARRRLWLTPALVGAGAMVLGLGIHLGLWFPLRTGQLPARLEVTRWGATGALITLAGGLLVGLVLLSRVRRRRSMLDSAVWLFGGVALGWMALDMAIAEVGHLGSARALAERIEAETTPETPIVAYKRYPQGLGFYTRRAVWIAGDRQGDFLQREIVQRYAEDARTRLEHDAEGLPVWDGRGNILTTAEMDALWAGPKRIVLICRWAEVAVFGSRRPSARILGGPFAGAGRTDLYLLENQPAR